MAGNVKLILLKTIFRDSARSQTRLRRPDLGTIDPFKLQTFPGICAMPQEASQN